MRRTASAIALAAVATVVPVALAATGPADAAPRPHSESVVRTSTYVAGTVVNAATGNELRGIVVTVRDVDSRGTVIGRDTTDAAGHFRITVDGDEFAVRVNGQARGYEAGWVTCSPHRVVPTWGEACSQAGGRLGQIRLDHL